MMPMEMTPRKIDWLQNAHRAVHCIAPELEDGDRHVTVRLAAHLLQRLPPELGTELLDLLPEPELRRALAPNARSDADPSIGYVQFLEVARMAGAMIRPGARLHLYPCAIEHAHQENADEEAGRVPPQRLIADAFLWAVAGDLPPDMKNRMLPHLPAELRSRMNLYSGFTEDQKVA